MENVINMIADKFGVDPDKAAQIASHLQSQGHDVPSLLQGGASAETLKGLLGDRAQGLLGGIPGVGGMLGGIFGGNSESSPAAEGNNANPGYAVAESSDTTADSVGGDGTDDSAQNDASDNSADSNEDDTQDQDSNQTTTSR